jgi:hypothetical protein
MSFPTVSHDTIHRYRQPVVPGRRRMMFRPRGSRDPGQIRSALQISPQPPRHSDARVAEAPGQLDA